MNEYKRGEKKKMSRLRILLAAVLCVSLLTFVGCGEEGNTDGNAENGTITEESTDMDKGDTDASDEKNGDDSMMDDMERGAEDMVDGLERDAKDASDSIRDGSNDNSRSNNAKESNVGQ